MASIGVCFLYIFLDGVYFSVDTARSLRSVSLEQSRATRGKSDKPFKDFSAFGGTALTLQCQAFGLVAECVKDFVAWDL
jgi:hypothetical protein